MPDTFLTGGSGFVGGALLRRLIADGRHVRALARSDEAERIVTVAGAEAVRGDLLVLGDWEGSLKGCDTLFHVAGEVAMCDRSRLEVNLAGTRTVVAAAARAGVRRIVFTSSAATIGEAAGTSGTETTVHTGQYLSGYARSKHLAEQAAFGDAERLGIELVSVNPSSVQGPGRTHGTARIFIGYLRGKLRWAVRTRMPIVFIDDAVNAHMLAESQGVAGERYLVCGWTPSVEEVVATLAGVTGIERKVRYLPGWMLSTAATLTEFSFRAARKQPPLCREMSREVRRGHIFDGSRAERELGLRYTEPEEWLGLTVQWYREQGLI